MQIDTNLGHQNHNRNVISIEKIQTPAEPAKDNTRNRVPLNPSLSRAILSNSLANVLWEVDGSSVASMRNSETRSGNGARSDAEFNWVRNAYAEYE